MAIIGEIRDRGGVLVLIFVGLSLIAFLLMDATSSSRGMSTSQFTVGKVNDKVINYNELNERINNQLNNIRSRSGGSVDEITEQTIRGQVWERYTSELIAEDEYDKLGISLSDDELTELMMGTNPHPFVSSNFTNPETNQFDNSRLQDFILNLDEEVEGQASPAEKRAQWNQFKNAVKRDVLENKYKNLIKKGNFVPDFLALNEYYENNNKVSFDYFVVPFSTLSDDEVQVNESDLQTYLTKNKGEFDNEATRAITYVEFPIIPTKGDSADANRYIVERRNDFSTTENDAQYLNSYSDLPFNDTYISKDNVFNSQKDKIVKARKGEIVGPYFENGAYVLAKVIDKVQTPDSVECRHILIRPESAGGIALAEIKADSIINALNSGGDFDVLAELHSDDKSNNTNGGYLNWAKPNQMVKPFNDLIFFDAKPKKIYKVQTQFGWHIVEVLKKKGKNPQIKIGYFAKNVEASGNTENSIYRIANKFSGQNRTPEAFKIGLKKQDLIDKQVSGLKLNDFQVEGIQGNARELIKWAFEAELNQVSEVFAFNDKYVVAKIDGKRDKGDYSVYGLRDQLTEAVIRMKKSDAITNKLSGGGNFNALSKVFGSTIKTVENVNLKRAFLTEDGNEPKVVSAAFNYNNNEVSKPIEGNNGIYVVKVSSKEEKPETSNLDLNRSTMQRSVSSNVDVNLFKALTESVEVEDFRHKFY